jgi:hypothetical protein
MLQALTLQRPPRYPMRLPFLHKPQAPAPVRVGVGWTRDLSEGGACVELAEALRPQMPLCIRLQTDQGPIEAEAQVIWTGEFRPGRGGVLHGIAFTHLAPTQLQALAGLLLFKGDMREAGARMPVDLPVTCLPRGPAATIRGRTGNVSRGGLMLRLSRSLPPRTELEVILHMSSGPVKAEGVIAWAGSPEGREPGAPIPHGLRFTSLNWSSSLALGLLLTVPS